MVDARTWFWPGSSVCFFVCACDENFEGGHLWSYQKTQRKHTNTHTLRAHASTMLTQCSDDDVSEWTTPPLSTMFDRSLDPACVEFQSRLKMCSSREDIETLLSGLPPEIETEIVRRACSWTNESDVPVHSSRSPYQSPFRKNSLLDCIFRKEMWKHCAASHCPHSEDGTHLWLDVPDFSRRDFFSIFAGYYDVTCFSCGLTMPDERHVRHIYNKSLAHME